MSLYQSNVIVLRSRNLGEADRVLMLLSEDHGKYEAVVKGARRQRSRFVGNTLPFNYISALFFPGKNLDTLSQAELLHSFSSLRENLKKLAYASFWVELVDSFLPEKEVAGEIFRFLLAAFIVLEGLEDPGLVNLAFQFRLLNYLGYQPEIETCVCCSAELNDQIGFSGMAGGVVCAKCGVAYRDLIPVTGSDLNSIKLLTAADLRNLAELELAKEEYQTLQRLVRLFIEARLEHPLKSRLFLDNILA